MAGPSGNAMQAMVAMQMAQHPQGPNTGGPPSGGPPPDLGPGDGSGGNGPNTDPSAGMPPQVLQQLAQAAQGPAAGNPQNGAALVALIQKLLPKLKLADHHNGVFELAGPTQDQFLGSVAAKHHGAKMHSVHNTGKGQRLHIAMP